MLQDPDCGIDAIYGKEQGIIQGANPERDGAGELPCLVRWRSSRPSH